MTDSIYSAYDTVNFTELAASSDFASPFLQTSMSSFAKEVKASYVRIKQLDEIVSQFNADHKLEVTRTASSSEPRLLERPSGTAHAIPVSGRRCTSRRWLSQPEPGQHFLIPHPPLHVEHVVVGHFELYAVLPRKEPFGIDNEAVSVSQRDPNSFSTSLKVGKIPFVLRFMPCHITQAIIKGPIAVAPHLSESFRQSREGPPQGSFLVCVLYGRPESGADALPLRGT